MIWAGIWLGGRTELIIIERDEESGSGRGYTANSYISTLEKGLVPTYTPEIVFQQDNAKIHLAKETKKWFETHGVYVEDWPAHSPDLNPIEPSIALVKSEAFCVISGAYWPGKKGGRLALF